MLVAVPLVLAGVAVYHFPASCGVEMALTGGKRRHACSPTVFLILLVGSVGGNAEANSKAGGSERSKSQYGGNER